MIHFQARHAHDVQGNGGGDGIVLGQKHTMPAEVALLEHLVLAGRLALLFGREQALHHMHETALEQRLGNEGVHAHRTGLLLDGRPVVGRQDDDGHVVGDNLANLAGRLDAAFARHLPIKNNGYVAALILDRMAHRLNGVLARQHVVGLHADGLQHLASAFGGSLLVVGHQHPQALQRRQILVVAVAQLHVHRHREGGALAELALHVDGAVHEVHHRAHDGHAKASALHLRDARIVGARERLEHRLHEVLGHAAARVGERELVAARALHAARQLLDAQAHGTAFGRELHRVAHDVHEHLLQAHRVAHHMLVLDVGDLYLQVQLLVVDLGGHDGHEAFHRLRQIEVLLRQPQVPALDLRHVEHLVDEPEQVTARGGDLREAVLHALRVVQIHRGDGGQSHDGVHGCANVVAHGIEEVGLGTARALGLAERVFQRVVVRNLALFHVGDILHRKQHARHLVGGVALQRQHGGLQPANLARVGILQAILEVQIRRVRRQMFANVLRRELGLHALGFLVVAEARLPVVAEHMVFAVARQVVLDALVLQILVGVSDQIDHREALEERQRRVHDARHMGALA